MHQCLMMEIAQRSLLTIMLICSLSALGSIVYEAGSFRGFLYGSEPAAQYDNWLSHVSEGLNQFSSNRYAPWDRQTNGFGNYHTPTNQELNNWKQVVEAYCGGQYLLVDFLLNYHGFDYQQVIFYDQNTAREYHLLRENLNNDIDDNGTETPLDDQEGSFNLGWGLYIRNAASERSIIVTSPHPKDDYPSVIMAWEGFEKWDARYFFIAGAGRECMYPYPYSFNNNYSISDPSRVMEHPFNAAYQSAADQIRSQFGRLELSIQVHTYDWNGVHNKPAVMLSAGHNRRMVQLPVRDFSRERFDLIHQAPYLIHPQGSIGDNDPVTILDYYSVYDSNEYPVRYQRDGYDLDLFFNDDYPGYSQNAQMLYTNPGNLYDLVNPFLHVEMDELPECYTHNQDTLKWFYGWDQSNENWDLSNRWTKFIAFYQRWINDLSIVLNRMMPLNDQQLPSNPSSLRPVTEGITWQRSYSYDFDSYEVFLRYQDNQGMQQQVILDRESFPILALQATELVDIWDYDLDTNQIVSVRICARDKNGNRSSYSNQLLISDPSLNNFTSLSSSLSGTGIRVAWTANSLPGQTTLGWNVYRSLDGEEYNFYQGYQNNPQLVAGAPNSGYFIDPDLEIGYSYYYRITRCLANGSEFISRGSTMKIMVPTQQLTLRVEGNSNEGNWHYSYQSNASDEYDSYDVSVPGGGNPGPSPALASYLTGESSYLSTEFKAAFNPLTELKTFNLVSYNTQMQAPITISSSGTATGQLGNLYLYDVFSDSWTDLRAGDFQLDSSSFTMRQYVLYWGAKRPELNFVGLSDGAIRRGETIQIEWEANPVVAVDFFTLYLVDGYTEYLLADQIPGTQSSYSWQVPEMFPLSTYRFKLIANKANSPATEYLSPARIQVLDDYYTATYSAGWQMISIPASAAYTTLFDLFGDYNSLYRILPDGTWQATEEIVANRAYLLRLQNAQVRAWPNNIPQSSYSFSLIPGWNMLPNPYQFPIPADSLIFILGGAYYCRSDLQAMGLLSDPFFTFRDGYLQAVESILPGESVMLRLSGHQELTVVVRQIASDWEIPPSGVAWSGALVFSDELGSYSNIVIGSAEDAGFAVDESFDYLAPPSFPGSSLQVRVLQGDAAEECFSGYQGLYPDYSQHSQSWDLVLNHSSSLPAKVSFLSTDLIPNCRIVLSLETGTYLLLPGQEQQIDLPQGERIFASLVITANYSDTSSPQPDQSGVLFAYPNPCRSLLTIELGKANQQGILEIFNLKGQLIRSYSVSAGNAGAIVWDGRDREGILSSAGIYFLRYRSGELMLTKKVIRLD